MWPLGILVKCVSRYWELILRSRDVLGRGLRVHRKEESRLFHKDLHSPLAMGTESEGRPQYVVTELGTRLGDWTWAEEESEDLQLACLLCWPACFSDRLSWWVPWKCFLDLGAGTME